MRIFIRKNTKLTILKETEVTLDGCEKAFWPGKIVRTKTSIKVPNWWIVDCFESERGGEFIFLFHHPTHGLVSVAGDDVEAIPEPGIDPGFSWHWYEPRAKSR